MNRLCSLAFAGCLAVALPSAAMAAPIVTDCAPSTVLEAAHGGRRVFIERALVYYDYAPDYSQSVCLDIETGDKEETGPSCDAPTWWRTDCSGFVSEAWNLSTSYSTAWLADGGTDANGNTWVTKDSWDALEIGDALNDPGHHIMLFTGWLDAAHTSFCVLEEADVGLTDDYGGLGCIADIESVASKKAAGFFPLALTETPDGSAEGALDSADCTSIDGWAADFDTPDAAVTVDLYADAPAGDPASVALGSIKADAERADLCELVGTCAHGFSAKTPDALLDGREHTIYAYAHGTGAPDDVAAITGTKTLSCDAPPPPDPSSSAAGASPTSTGSANGDNDLSGSVGCSVSATRSDASFAFAAALGLAVIAGARRRARR
jgi:MYXO-CTERM domain-containing protein